MVSPKPLSFFLDIRYLLEIFIFIAWSCANKSVITQGVKKPLKSYICLFWVGKYSIQQLTLI